MSESVAVRDDMCSGASVLPYSFSPDDGTLFFLLGREAYRQPRRHLHAETGDVTADAAQTRPLHRREWSDFGGYREASESPTACAERELFEETLGLVSIPALDSHQQAQAMLSIDVELSFGRPAGSGSSTTPVIHRLYVLPITWQPDVPRLFQERHQALSRLEEASVRLTRAVGCLPVASPSGVTSMNLATRAGPVGISLWRSNRDGGWRIKRDNHPCPEGNVDALVSLGQCRALMAEGISRDSNSRRAFDALVQVAASLLECKDTLPRRLFDAAIDKTTCTVVPSFLEKDQLRYWGESRIERFIGSPDVSTPEQHYDDVCADLGDAHDNERTASGPPKPLVASRLMCFSSKHRERMRMAFLPGLAIAHHLLLKQPRPSVCPPTPRESNKQCGDCHDPAGQDDSDG
ncbi:hypothetical protein [Mollivirus kamchatka]|nr:hypothetical protein [Mollivirus kamchatka]